VWFVVLPALLFGTLGVLGPLRLSQLGFGAVGIGAVWLVTGGLEAVNNVAVGRAADRYGPFVPIRVALVGTVLTTLLLPWPENPYVLAVLIGLAGIAFGTFYTPGMTLLTHAAEERGARLRLRLRAREPRLGAGAERRSARRRRDRAGDLRRRAVPRALGRGAAYPCRAVAVSKLLVANRGEIALASSAPRDASTSRPSRSPHRTTARAARPLRRRDGRAWRPTSTPTTMRARPRDGADAVHPGYGFLAENADFAEAVADAASSGSGRRRRSAQGGDKLEAKRIAAEAGVPVVPGGEPREVGYPLLVKAAAAAAAAGCGRALAAELDDASRAASARRRSVRRRPLSLRALPRAAAPRRDPAARGRARRRRALGERECSCQRRHQKVLEERPRSRSTPSSAHGWRGRRALRRGASATSAPARSSSCSTAATSTSSS
jgi:hypothetical protein